MIMRVLHQDRKAGEIKLMVDNLDDLWHLYNIINVGDMIISLTFRRDEAKTDKIRAERAEKKRMVLGIKVEKVEFSESDSRLRILGVIIEGPQDLGAHHTLNIGEGDSLTIRKQDWKDSQLERIKRAVDDAKKPRLLFVSLENDEAIIAVTRQFGVQEIAHITAGSSGKMYDQKDGGDFFGEIITKIKQNRGTGGSFSDPRSRVRQRILDLSREGKGTGHIQERVHLSYWTSWDDRNTRTDEERSRL